MPAADQLKAVFAVLIRQQQDRLAKVSAELQQAQGSANTTQGSLDACLTNLKSHRQEAAVLQEKLEIENQASRGICGIRQRVCLKVASLDCRWQ